MAGRVTLRAVGVAAAAALTVAVLGAITTDIGVWYEGLVKPSWKPPDAAFGLIWTVIFAFAAASGAIGWRDAPARRVGEWMIGLFALNGFFNLLWSLLFFRLHRPDWALEEVGLLWASVALLMVFFFRFSRLAAALLIPYLVWVSIAAYLNFEIVRTNGPFG